MRVVVLKWEELVVSEGANEIVGGLVGRIIDKDLAGFAGIAQDVGEWNKIRLLGGIWWIGCDGWNGLPH